MIAPDTLLIVCRFLFFGTTMLFWGSSVYLWALVPPALARQMSSTLRPAVTIAVSVVVATTAVMLPLHAAGLGDGWADALSLDVLRSLLFETSIGSAWLVQAFAAILLAIIVSLPTRHQLPGIAVCSALLLMSPSLTGHATMDSGWLKLLHRTNDVVHLLAAGAWFGALVPVLMIIRRLNQPQAGRDAGVAVARFSRAGHVVVAIVLISGLGNMLFIVGGLPLDWGLLYQMLLSAKIAFVGILVSLAATNRYVFVPLMELDRAKAVRALVWGTTAEIFIGLVVIGLVAWFGMLQPT